MVRPSDPLLFERVRALCAARGMNLVGAVVADEYDATQPCGRRALERMPRCGTILLLGSGGRASWEAVLRELDGPLESPHRGYHPVDRWSESVARDALTELELHGHRGRLHAADACPPLNFRQLGEMAGLGVISPVIGHLLHPEFGPWVSLRTAILLEGRPFGDVPQQPIRDFDPCGTCDKPCVRSCPADTYHNCGRIDLMACAHARLEGGCESGCETLRACPLGADHRYGPDEEAFRHAYSLFSVRKWAGAGWWRLVPRFWRQRV